MRVAMGAALAAVIATGAEAQTFPSDEMAARCQTAWPDVASVQAYCVDQQEWGFDTLVERKTDLDADGEVALETCEGEWPGDFAMQAYCLNYRLAIEGDGPSVVDDRPHILQAECTRAVALLDLQPSDDPPLPAYLQIQAFMQGLWAGIGPNVPSINDMVDKFRAACRRRPETSAIEIAREIGARPRRELLD